MRPPESPGSLQRPVRPWFLYEIREPGTEVWARLLGRERGFELARARSRGSRFWQTKYDFTRQQSASYQGAFEAVLAVPIAAGIGYWWDGRFDSAPIGLLVGTAIGFAAMLLRILRMRPSDPSSTTDTNTESETTVPDRDPESDR